ncbi:hypothetical protein GBA52_010449 [Prunus armeniaca]|nr:hypothetical protein GBA52_010449 [Prunus armeniaca]
MATKRTGPADFKRGFLSTLTTNSSKTGPVRTSTLPSSSPSYSPPRSAAVVAGINHKTGGFEQIFLKLSPAVSPSSDHQTGRIRIRRIVKQSPGYSRNVNPRVRFTVTIRSCNRYGFQTHREGTPPVALRQFVIYDHAPRVSATPEPCGTRIAAQVD